MLNLQSKEGEIIPADNRLANMSNLIRGKSLPSSLSDMVEDNANADEMIPIKLYSASCLKLMLQFCEQAGWENGELLKKPIIDTRKVFQREWEQEFMGNLSEDQLYELIEVRIADS